MDATDFYGLSVLIRRIHVNPQFLLVAETMINALRALRFFAVNFLGINGIFQDFGPCP
jgi:hypothetical protein